MSEIDFVQLGKYTKIFSGLTPEREILIAEAGKEIVPHLPQVTENFYINLQKVPQVAPFIDNKLDHLKQTHLAWLQQVFAGKYDQSYIETMYRVGYVHVQVNLPVEFMSGGITLITNELLKIISKLYKNEPEKYFEILAAINSVFGFSLLIMQASYQASVSEVLNRFLAITGMSKVLFENLSEAYNTTAIKTG